MSSSFPVLFPPVEVALGGAQAGVPEQHRSHNMDVQFFANSLSPILPCARPGAFGAFGATRLEEAFEQRVLEALTPPGMAAMLEAETAYRQADEKPRTLEQPLSTEEKARLRRFAENLPRLWRAPTTRVQDKKRLIRCLVEQMVVRVPDDEAPLQAPVHWVGGAVTPITVPKGRVGVHRDATDPEIVDWVRQLSDEFSDEQIARILHRKGLKTSKGLAFTTHRVTHLRYAHKIPGHTRAKLQEAHIHTVEQAAERLGISRRTGVHWIELGLLKGSQITPGAPWRVALTDEDCRRLTAGDAPAGWLTLKAAAQALGVSQQTVVKKLNTGELEGIRVQAGARTAWRIRFDSIGYDRQQTLFD